MKRKLLITLIISAIALFSFGAISTSAYGYDYGYYTYILSGNNAIILDVDKAISGDIIIPSVMDDHPVIGIRYNAFDKCTNLTGVKIPDSVTYIEQYAFYECTNLQRVTIGSGVTTVGEGAFYMCESLATVEITDLAAWCNISFANADANPLCWANTLIINNVLVKDLVIPYGVKTIKMSVFNSCTNIESVYIPDTVTHIDIGAFYNCPNLTKVTLENNVETIDDYAFDGCNKLTNVIYNGTEDEWNKITIKTDNSPLTNADIRFLVTKKGTKTTVSDDGKSFLIKPSKIENGKSIILALFDGNTLVDIHRAICTGADIPYTTTKNYTNAQVMIWGDLINIAPEHDVEIVK